MARPTQPNPRIASEEEMAKYMKPQDEVCDTRQRYRKGRKDTAVKVYTINQESNYLIVRNIPAVGATRELLERFALHGAIQEWRMLDETANDQYTDVMWLKFFRVEDAKEAKKKMDDYNFYSNLLNVIYAPEYESAEETWTKLQMRRLSVVSRLHEIGARGERVPQRGKRPNFLDRNIAVPPPLPPSAAPFAAPPAPYPVFPGERAAQPLPSGPRREYATPLPPPSNPPPAAAPPGPPPPGADPTFDGTVAEIRAKMRKVSQTVDPFAKAGVPPSAPHPVAPSAPPSSSLPRPPPAPSASNRRRI